MLAAMRWASECRFVSSDSFLGIKKFNREFRIPECETRGHKARRYAQYAGFTEFAIPRGPLAPHKVR